MPGNISLQTELELLLQRHPSSVVCVDDFGRGIGISENGRELYIVGIGILFFPLSSINNGYECQGGKVYVSRRIWEDRKRIDGAYNLLHQIVEKLPDNLSPFSHSILAFCPLFRRMEEEIKSTGLPYVFSDGNPSHFPQIGVNRAGRVGKRFVMKHIDEILPLLSQTASPDLDPLVFDLEL